MPWSAWAHILILNLNCMANGKWTMTSVDKNECENTKWSETANENLLGKHQNEEMVNGFDVSKFDCDLWCIWNQHVQNHQIHHSS